LNSGPVWPGAMWMVMVMGTSVTNRASADRRVSQPRVRVTPATTNTAPEIHGSQSGSPIASTARRQGDCAMRVSISSARTKCPSPPMMKIRLVSSRNAGSAILT